MSLEYLLPPSLRSSKIIAAHFAGDDVITLSDKELIALHNLADKQAGETVDWINIGDARSLTELGLAKRNRGGWEITPEGLSLIKSQAARDRLKLVTSSEPTALRPHQPPNNNR